MKKTLAAVMAAVMAVSFAAFIVGCDDDDEEVEEVAALGMSTVQGVVERGGLSARIAAAAVAGVTVTLEDAAGNVVATAVTDASGRFKFENVPPGNYVVRVEYQGKTGAWAVSVFQEEVIEMVISLDDAGFANCCIYRDPEPEKPEEPEEPEECNYGRKNAIGYWWGWMPEIVTKFPDGWMPFACVSITDAMTAYVDSCMGVYTGTAKVSCSGKVVTRFEGYIGGPIGDSGELVVWWSVKNGVGKLEFTVPVTESSPVELSWPISMLGPYPVDWFPCCP